MLGAAVPTAAIEVFAHYYGQLQAGATGLISEDSIEPLVDPPQLDQLQVDPHAAAEALAHTAIIKLNGGLGTSMGMDRAKSLLTVRDGKSFLVIVAGQIRAARAAFGVRTPLLLMNSFNTVDDTRAALAAHPDLAVDGLPLDFVQSQEPKLRTDDLTPVEWPADPRLEWCPPGHGDLYPSLLAGGVLQQLLEAGFHYASVSNVDNLAAGPDARLAGWFAHSGAPFAVEVCRRTPMDRKGGHLAVRRADGQLILRETAQTSSEEMHFFTDEHRHQYFNTNNLWLDLRQLQQTLTDRGGVLGLPLIRNVKTVDPRDRTSPQVYQVETAMGAAVEIFEGAEAIAVPRSRFLPVKTTNELLLLRSDVYQLDGEDRLHPVCEPVPVISLGESYTTIGDFEARFASGPPSLREAGRFTVEGDWTFGAGVRVCGDVTLPATDGAQRVADGAVLGRR
jgi:UTP--glucose-1-phosphate uridylyltransferase